MKNKKAIIGLGAIATLLFGVASSIAYLTDTESDVNVMTVGNVKIAQLEYERVVDENGNATTELQPYSQLKPIVPAVYKNATKTVAWDENALSWEQIGAPKSHRIFDESVKNVIDKFIFVENTGRKDAYYRTIVALEDPAGLSLDALHLSIGATLAGERGSTLTEVGYITVDGVRYIVYEFLYTEELAPGKVSEPSLMQVFLDPKTTSEDVEKYGNTFEVLAISQAVQTDGFDSAKEALDEAFGESNVTNATEWFGGLSVVVENGSAEEMSATITEALENGTNIVVDKNVDLVAIAKDENGAYNYDANGATVTLNGEGTGNFGYLSLAQENASTADIKNLNVTGAGFVELGHHNGSSVNRGTYTVENATIKDMEATLGVVNGTDKVAAAFAHYGTATLNNCVMTGTTTAKSGYTAYDAGFVNGTKTFINGGEYGSMYIWNQAHVTIKEAKVGTIVSSAITTSNLGKLTISAGTTVDTIKLVPGKYTPAIVIEDGATVGKIIYKGVTYTQAEWLAR